MERPPPGSDPNARELRRRRVEEVFQEVVDLPPGERDARLEDLCGDPGIRAEVLVLCKLAGSDLGGFLESPVVAEARRPGLEGRQVGRYAIQHRIGEGGFGSVYLAEQMHPIRRKVALKVLKRGVDTKEVVARFEAERQALALMDHPSIARVFDAGETEDGLPYFVMEHVAGEPITDYCDRHRLSIDERLKVFLTVLEAVQHAHQKGIIHRDIKPSNILVTSLAGDARAKVIDFGVAKAVSGQRLTEMTLATQVHTLIGTPAYMSPEQADLTSADVDTRSDIYSLGAVLYELLSGGTPLHAATLQKAGIDEIRRLVRDTEAVRPSSRLVSLTAAEAESIAERRRCDPVRLVSALRGDLDWIVLEALEKDRTRRYSTAGDFAADIERYLRSEAVAARPPSRLYVLRKTVRRHRTVFGAAAAVVFLLVVGIVVTSLLMFRARRAELAQFDLRLQADAARNEAMLRAYAADMKAASIALGQGHLGQTASLLDRYAPRPGAPDVRGFEWGYLRHLARGNELRSFAHDQLVSFVLFGPGGDWVAGATFSGELRVWEVETGRLLATIPGLRRRHPMALCAGGRMLALSRADRVTIHETGEWRVVHELQGGAHALGSSADGLTFARFTDDGIHLHETTSWKETARLAPARPWEGELAIDAAGRKLLSFIYSGEVDLWDIPSKRCIIDSRRLPVATSVALSHDGRYGAMGRRDGSLSLWDLEQVRELATAGAHGQWLLGMAFSPDGRTLASGGSDQCIRLWDLTSEPPGLSRPAGVLRGHWNEVWSVRFSPDGRRLVSGAKDAMVKVWPATAPGASHVELPQVPDSCCYGFSADGSLFRTLSTGREIRFWRTADGQPAQVFHIPEDALGEQHGHKNWPLWVRDRLHLGLLGGEIGVWEFPRGERIRSVRLGAESVYPVAASQDERVLAGWDQKAGQAAVWDFASGEKLAVLPRYRFASSAGPPGARISISPDGRWIAYAAADNRVLVWDVVAGLVHRELPGHVLGVYCVTFSPDGKLLATAGGDGAVVLWDWAAPRMAVPPLRGHLAGVLYCAFSSDGRTLVSDSAEGTLRFWSVATGTEVLHLEDASSFWGCPVSPDGRTVGWLQRSKNTVRLTRLE